MAYELGEANSVGSGEGSWQRERHRWGWGRGGRDACPAERDACPAGCDAAVRLEDCPLSEATVGEAVTVTDLQGDEAFRGKVMGIGIYPGVSLSVVRGGTGGPLLIALPGSRCMLDRRSSELIMVRNGRSHGERKRR